MKKFLMKVLVGSLASVVILISVCWSYKITANESISAVQTNTTIDLNQNNEDDSGREKQIKNEEPISILLIGLDNGALMYENEQSSRSDAIILATLNPKTGQTTLTNIPRDTWLPIDGVDEFNKVNHAYMNGGIVQSKQAISQYLGVPIDYFVTVDMKAFIEVIDTFGGLELTPNQTFTQNNASFTEGQRENFTGEEVIHYARMRKQDPNGDNGRQVRQQQVIKEIIGQYFDASILKQVPKLYKLYQDNVETNLNVSEITKLVTAYQPALESINSVDFKERQDIEVDDTYYMYIPENQRNNIHKALEQNLEIDNDFNPIIYPVQQIPEQPYLYDEDILVDIQNGVQSIPAKIYTKNDLTNTLKNYHYER